MAAERQTAYYKFAKNLAGKFAEKGLRASTLFRHPYVHGIKYLMVANIPIPLPEGMSKWTGERLDNWINHKISYVKRQRDYADWPKLAALRNV